MWPFGRKSREIETKEEFLRRNPRLFLIGDGLDFLSYHSGYKTLSILAKRADEYALPVFEGLVKARKLIENEKDLKWVARKLTKLSRRQIEIHVFPRRLEKETSDKWCFGFNKGPSSELVDSAFWEALWSEEKTEIIKNGLAVLRDLPWEKIDSRQALSRSIMTLLRESKFSI